MTHIVVYVASGCGACHEYMPRLARLSQPYRRMVKFHVYDVTGPLDGAAARLGQTIDATPTTVVIKNGRETERRTGALGDAELDKLLARAAGP